MSILTIILTTIAVLEVSINWLSKGRTVWSFFKDVKKFFVERKNKKAKAETDRINKEVLAKFRSRSLERRKLHSSRKCRAYRNIRNNKTF